MKKGICVLVFMLLGTVVFSQEFQLLFTDIFYTSEGIFGGTMSYIGKNTGQAFVDKVKNRIPTTKISNGQWETVRRMLNRYQHSKGDTYLLILIPCYSNLEPMEYGRISIFIEFTSSTQYNWWASIIY